MKSLTKRVRTIQDNNTYVADTNYLTSVKAKVQGTVE